MLLETESKGSWWLASRPAAEVIGGVSGGCKGVIGLNDPGSLWDFEYSLSCIPLSQTQFLTADEQDTITIAPDCCISILV